MRYSVEITETALADAEAYVSFIREHSNDDQAAALWWNGLLDAVDSLGELPGRCPAIPEAKHFAGEVRQLLYASHRIIFEIEPGVVSVLRIYHAARKALRPVKKR